MENIEKILTALLAAPLVIVLINWVLSLICTRSKGNYLLADLKQLWPDSLPFLKAQWPILTVVFAVAIWFQLPPAQEMSDKVELDPSMFLLPFGSAVISWILNLFYVNYLAAPKYPGRVATIGVWALAIYVISDTAILAFGALGIIFFVIPGLMFFVRSCLFLPIYATQGYKPLSAVKRSWALTKGKYWLISRYMGLPVLLMVAFSVYPDLTNNLNELDSQAVTPTCQPLTIAIMTAAQLQSLVNTGLLYKLYERLLVEQEQQLTT